MDRHGGQRAHWIPDYSLQRSPVDSFVAYPAPVLHNRDRTSFTTTSATGHQRATRESPSLSLSLCVLRERKNDLLGKRGFLDANNFRFLFSTVRL